jgi:hypothetical protein
MPFATGTSQLGPSTTAFGGPTHLQQSSMQQFPNSSSPITQDHILIPFYNAHACSADRQHPQTNISNDQLNAAIPMSNQHQQQQQQPPVHASNNRPLSVTEQIACSVANKIANTLATKLS